MTRTTAEKNWFQTQPNDENLPPVSSLAPQCHGLASHQNHLDLYLDFYLSFSRSHRDILGARNIVGAVSRRGHGVVRGRAGHLPVVLGRSFCHLCLERRTRARRLRPNLSVPHSSAVRARSG